jgi:hypothetical protein
VSTVISIGKREQKPSGESGLRNRRYAIRHPFAAPVELLELETGARMNGVTSDISLGGCFVCTSKPLPLRTRARMTITRKDGKVELLVAVRVVKPRIGMGLEFLDVDEGSLATLTRWLDQLNKTR